jgi:hypothetical protein
MSLQGCRPFVEIRSEDLEAKRFVFSGKEVSV